jgi:hypothetical protein
MSYASYLEHEIERASDYYAVALNTLENRFTRKPVTPVTVPAAVLLRSPPIVPVPDVAEIAERVRRQRETHILCLLEMRLERA